MNLRTLRLVALSTVLALALIAARERPSRAPVVQAPVIGPTFNKEVSRILQQQCQSCHHAGDVAPFSLMTYEDARSHASLIKLMTATREMPPWKASGGCGDFAQERVLSQAEIDTLGKWVSNGAPEGNPADVPPQLNFDSGWALGQPDMIVSNSEAYTPPASGDMYRCFTVPTNLTADQYVAAIDVHPGDRQSVHHVIAYLDTTGESVKLDEKDPGPGYTSFGGPGFSNPGTLGGWAPGARPVMLPDGVAMSLPAASRVVLQVHYHPHDATPKADKTEIGIYYAKKKPSKLLRFLPLANTTFTIPPGNANYRVNASFPIALPVATHLWIIAPHMHLLGRKMKVEATLPNGQKQCLINIEDWDFNWQGLYRYKDPVALPTLTRLASTSYYDNSPDNPRNPNLPPKAVSWGEETTDEMNLAFLGVTLDSENLATTGQADVRWIPPLFPPPTR